MVTSEDPSVARRNVASPGIALKSVIAHCSQRSGEDSPHRFLSRRGLAPEMTPSERGDPHLKLGETRAVELWLIRPVEIAIQHRLRGGVISRWNLLLCVRLLGTRRGLCDGLLRRTHCRTIRSEKFIGWNGDGSLKLAPCMISRRDLTDARMWLVSRSSPEEGSTNSGRRTGGDWIGRGLRFSARSATSEPHQESRA